MSISPSAALAGGDFCVIWLGFVRFFVIPTQEGSSLPTHKLRID